MGVVYPPGNGEGDRIVRRPRTYRAPGWGARTFLRDFFSKQSCNIFPARHARKSTPCSGEVRPRSGTGISPASAPETTRMLLPVHEGSGTRCSGRNLEGSASIPLHYRMVHYRMDVSGSPPPVVIPAAGRHPLERGCLPSRPCSPFRLEPAADATVRRGMRGRSWTGRRSLPSVTIN